MRRPIEQTVVGAYVVTKIFLVLAVCFAPLAFSASQGPSDAELKSDLEERFGNAFEIGGISRDNESFDESGNYVGDIQATLTFNEGIDPYWSRTATSRSGFERAQEAYHSFGEWESGDQINATITVGFSRKQNGWKITSFKRCCTPQDAPTDSEIERALDDAAPVFMESKSWARDNVYALDNGNVVTIVTGTVEYSMSFDEFQKKYRSAPMGKKMVREVRDQHGWFHKGKSVTSTVIIFWEKTPEGWVDLK